MPFFQTFYRRGWKKPKGRAEGKKNACQNSQNNLIWKKRSSEDRFCHEYSGPHLTHSVLNEDSENTHLARNMPTIVGNKNYTTWTCAHNVKTPLHLPRPRVLSESRAWLLTAAHFLLKLIQEKKLLCDCPHAERGTGSQGSYRCFTHEPFSSFGPLGPPSYTL